MPPTNLLQFLSPNSRLLTDVVFEVYPSPTSSTPVKVLAHKCFLANANPVFDKMFFQSGKAREPQGAEVTIQIKNKSEDVFRMFLKHMYGEELLVENLLSLPSVLQMFELVEQYNVVELKETLLNKMKTQVVERENFLSVVDLVKGCSGPSEAKGERQISNRTCSFHPEYGNDIKDTRPELLSIGVVSDEEDDFADILDLPPMKVKTMQRKETESREVYEKEDKEENVPGKMFRMKGGTVWKKKMASQNQNHSKGEDLKRWMDQGDRNAKLDEVKGLLLNCRGRMGMDQEDQDKGGGFEEFADIRYDGREEGLMFGEKESEIGCDVNDCDWVTLSSI